MSARRQAPRALSRAPARRAQAGLTLIELVAAIAVFAVVAVMAMQILGGALRQNEALERLDADGAALIRTLALIRRDLESAVPVRFQPPQGPAEAAVLPLPGDSGLALSVGGHAVPGGTLRSGLIRVTWRLDPATGVLSRQVWPTLDPRRNDQAGVPVSMLDGVQRLAFVSPGLAPGALPDPDTVPRGMELRLDTVRHGPLRIVVSR